MEQRSLKEVCDASIARINAYYLAHPDQEKAHRLWKRRRALKEYSEGLPMVHGYYCPSARSRFHVSQNDSFSMLAQSQRHMRSPLNA